MSDVTSWRIVCIGIPGVEPVKVELTDFKTKEVVDTLEVDAVLVATGRAPFTQVRAPIRHYVNRNRKATTN